MTRPGFRKGGMTGNGIMTGISERNQYQIGGSTEKRIMDRQKLLQKYAGQPDRSTALANLLISGGLKALQGSGVPGRSTIQELAGAYEQPVQVALGQKAKEDAFQRQLGLASVKGVLSEDAAERLQRMKIAAASQKGYESGTRQSQINALSSSLEKSLPEYGKGSEMRKFIPDIADKVITFKRNLPGASVQPTPDLENFTNVPVGTYFYNYKTGQYYLRKKDTLTDDAFEIVDAEGKSLTTPE